MTTDREDIILLVRSILEAFYRGVDPIGLIEDVKRSEVLTYNEKALSEFLIKETAKLIYTGQIASSLENMIHD